MSGELKIHNGTEFVPSTKAYYDFTVRIRSLADLDAAITATTPGDWVILSDITLDADKTIPEGVTLHFRNNASINCNSFDLSGTNTEIVDGSFTNSSFSGTFTNTKKIYAYNTISDLISDSNIWPGKKCKTSGYYAENDNGAASYIIINDDTLVEDLGSVFDLSNGLKAVLILENDFILATQFGAKRMSYNATFYDSTSNLQNAIDFISQSGEQPTAITSVRKLIINGDFYTQELTVDTLKSVNIEGYNYKSSLLTYCGSLGYLGDGDFVKTGYILKVASTNNAVGIRNIGFQGYLDNINQAPTSIAMYGIVSEALLDHQSFIEYNKFDVFIESGVYLSNGALNCYLKHNRWNVSGRAYIKVNTFTSLTISNFTFDIAWHNYTFRSAAIKALMANIPWFDDSGTQPLMGNTFFNAESTGATAAFKMENARIEGGDLVEYTDNKTSYIQIDDDSQNWYDYRTTIHINDINNTVGINSLVRVITAQAFATRAPFVKLSNFNYVDDFRVLFLDGGESYESGFYEGVKYPIETHKNSLKTAHRDFRNIITNSAFDLNTLQLDVVNTITAKPGFYKFNDILLNVNAESGSKGTNTYNSIGVTCIKPERGYGLNLDDSFVGSPISCNIATSSTITVSTLQIFANAPIRAGFSYTITYQDTSTQEVYCIDVVDNGDTTYTITFDDTLIDVGNTAEINVTKCEWKPFGKKTLTDESGTTSERPENPILMDDYFNTDTGRFEKYDGSGFHSFANVLTASASLDFGSIDPQSQEILTMTLTGVTTAGWVAFANPSSGLLVGLTFHAYVSSPNNISIVMSNIGSVARDQGATTFKVVAIKL